MSELERKMEAGAQQPPVVGHLFGAELRRRIGSVAINAMREVHVALGRGDQPWIDDDWRRYDVIIEMLSGMQPFENPIEHTSEPDPLVNVKNQAPPSPMLDAVDAALRKLPVDPTTGRYLSTSELDAAYGGGKGKTGMPDTQVYVPEALRSEAIGFRN